MVEYNTVNAKLSNSELNKLKRAVNINEGTTLRMNARMFNSDNLPLELLLTTRQTTKLRNAIENNMSTDIKLPKVQVSKIIQSGGFLGKLLDPLLRTGLPLLKSVIKSLGLLDLTAVSSAIDAGDQKKIYGSGTTTLVISNEEINDIMKIVKALEDSGILLKGVTKTVENEVKSQSGGYSNLLLGTLASTLLSNLIQSGKGIYRTGYGNKRDLKKALIPPHPSTNFEIEEYYENEPRFNGVYSRDNLPKTIKNGAYVINLNENADVGTNWIALYVKIMKLFNLIVLVLNVFLKKLKDLLDIKTKANIFRIKADNSIMCGYFCIGFIEFYVCR